MKYSWRWPKKADTPSPVRRCRAVLAKVTLERKLANIKDAISGYLEVLRKHGKPVPEVEVEIVEVAVGTISL